MSLSRRQFCAASLAASVSLDRFAQAQDTQTASAKPPFRVSVNLAGAEFGGAIPGRVHKDYTFNSPKTFRYFADHGVRHFRYPIKWERLQPQPHGELDAAYLGGLMKALDQMEEAGCAAIADLHNYGRYKVPVEGKRVTAILGQEKDGKTLLPVSALSDVWQKLAKQLKGHAGVVALGTMNEPHDMAGLDWNAASNQVVQAIRAEDADCWITVCGNAWAAAQHWVKANGETPWIDDARGRTLYEAHAYFDSNRSGSYKLSYEEELKRDQKLPNRPAKELKPFLTWCRQNNVPGYIGEIGVPNEPGWLELLAQGCQLIAEADCAIGYWAAGEWWGNYPLSAQPKTTDAPLPPQMQVVVDNMRA